MRFIILYLLLLFCVTGCQSSVTYPAGGYAYIKDVADSDSDYYFLPIRKLIPRADSMAYDRTKYFFKSFDEPNISIKPADEDIFRLSIEGYGVKATVIRLTEDVLIVKQPKPDNKASIYPVENTDQLTETERQHYYFLNKFFPFGKRNYVAGRQLYIDSMIHSYPKLAYAAYYRYLIAKVADKTVAPFEYTSKKIPLTANQFKTIADAINASGYWNLPYQPALLEEAGTDGWGFCLETNTSKQYNFVACNGDLKTAGTEHLKQACQQILRYAQITDEFKIWSNEQEK